eukprot:m51a1_g6048 hypothetical protein (874) ;mRNA; r:203684-207390
MENDSDTRHSHSFKDNDVAPPQRPSERLPYGAITLCEVDGRMHSFSGDDDPILRSLRLHDCVVYPMVSVRTDLGDGCARVSRESVTQENVLLDDTAMQPPSDDDAGSADSSDGTAHDDDDAAAQPQPQPQPQPQAEQQEGEQQQQQGEAGTLAVVRSHVVAAATHPAVVATADYAARFLKYAATTAVGLWNTWAYPSIPSDAALEKSIPPGLRIRKGALVRAIGWHKFRTLFAVAQSDSTIAIYDVLNQLWHPVTLGSTMQHGVTCLEWQPCASLVLAAGTMYGVCLWEVGVAPQSSSGATPFAMSSGAWMRLLRHDALGPVTSVAWAPSGCLLAASSPTSTSILVWNAVSGQPSIVRGAGLVSCLSWSPDGAHLLVGTTGPFVRLYETSTWKHVNISTQAAFCRSASWGGPASFVLSFAGSPVLQFFLLEKRPEEVVKSYRLESLERYMAQPLPERQSPYEAAQADASRSLIPAGGRGIKGTSWDASGRRLAVFFDTEEVGDGSELVAVFQTNATARNSLAPVGWIRGPAGAHPLAVSFATNFPRGALLSVAWTNGKVALYPLYMTNERKFPDRAGPLPEAALEVIFALLSTEQPPLSLMRAARVCKLWHSVVYLSPDCRIQRVVARLWPQARLSEALASLSRSGRLSYVRSADLSESSVGDDALRSVVTASWGRLERLDVSRCPALSVCAVESALRGLPLASSRLRCLCAAHTQLAFGSRGFHYLAALAELAWFPRPTPGRIARALRALRGSATLKRVVLCAAPFGTGPLRAVCGECKQVLYARIDEYVVVPGSQGHIAFELLTDAAPSGETATSSGGMPGAQLNCAKNCHGRRWLIDCDTGLIENYKRKFALACGPGLVEVTEVVDPRGA